MTERTCDVDGCGKAHRAKGLCVTHYNQQMPNRYRKVTVACDYCGKPCVKYKQSVKYKARFCSLECRDLLTYRPQRVPVLYVAKHPPRRVRQPVVRTDQPRLFVCGVCPWCREPFVTRQPAARFCAPRCSKTWWRLQYKESRGFRVPRTVRVKVYRRDRGICQLCFEPVDLTLGPTDPAGPTLDHIVCQSWTLIPDHRPGNLRLAHRRCNSMRGDRAA